MSIDGCCSNFWQLIVLFVTLFVLSCNIYICVFVFLKSFTLQWKRGIRHQFFGEVNRSKQPSCISAFTSWSELNTSPTYKLGFCKLVGQKHLTKTIGHWPTSTSSWSWFLSLSLKEAEVMEPETLGHWPISTSSWSLSLSLSLKEAEVKEPETLGHWPTSYTPVAGLITVISL